MDIKQLTQEVLLKNMTQEQQLAVLDSVTASVKEAKAIQKQKIAENVDLVLQALKRIEADMLKRVEGSANIVEERIKTIKDGKDGKNGLDGKAGKDGINGKDGKNGRDGRDGLDGKEGERGQDGVGVQNAHIDFDGSLIISLTNGQELNVGEVVPFDVAEKIRVIGNGGGTSQYVIDTLASLQTQINAVSTGLIYKGTWNASTNTPSLASGTGTNGWYYVVSVAGSTNLNGVTDWQVGDWAIFNGSTWQKIDQTNLVTSVNGNTGAVVIGAVPTGGTAGQVLSKIDATDFNSQWIDNYATQVKLTVKNATGSTIPKGSVVYISGATGANALISLAKADSDATSATTIGLLESTLTNGSSGYVITTGTLTGIDTSAATEGDPVWLSGTTAGAKVYGITNKPNAPTHIVYLGTVTRAHATVGEIQIMVNNGWELDELHNVSALSPTTGQTIVYNSATGLWEKNTVSLTVGVNGTLPIANGGTGANTASAALTALGAYPSANPSGYTNNTGTVTSVGGTGTVSGLSLSGTVTTSGNLTLGGTLAVTPANFASQTANTVLAAPNGVAGTPTFRALVAADVPTLNQNTTGTSENVTGTVAIANGGTGATTALGARTNLGLVIGTDVLAPNGSAASLTSFPTFNQNTTGSAGSVATASFSIVESGGKLLFKFGATTIASMSSTGVITSATNIVSNGTP